MKTTINSSFSTKLQTKPNAPTRTPSSTKPSLLPITITAPIPLNLHATAAHSHTSAATPPSSNPQTRDSRPCITRNASWSCQTRRIRSRTARSSIAVRRLLPLSAWTGRIERRRCCGSRMPLV
ncbi:unnamed protein product [Periconia digitata]|uniref:Uncharacterized protein n=1 Tax=Periconia digitata TaxID=1303443 RepID=A0A9W4UVH0_9PLEO|nr:unnamed protein product [Periconia digitata]